MRSTTHSLAGGAAAGAAALACLPHSPLAAAGAITFGTVVAGELPDLDVAGSRLSRGSRARHARGLMRTPLLLLAIPAVLLGLLTRLLLKPLGRLGAHRGATHTMVGLVVFTILIPPAYLGCALGLLHVLPALHPAAHEPATDLARSLAGHAPSVLAVLSLSTLAGVASHLALDWLTPSGIPAAAPFSTRRYHAPLTVRTGSMAELPIAALMLLLWAIAVLNALER